MQARGRQSAPRRDGATGRATVERLEARAMFAAAGGADIPGARFVELAVGPNTALSASARAPDGKIVVCGYTRAAPFAGASRDLFVARLNPDGSFDPSFGENGRGFVYQDVIFAGGDEVAGAVMVQPDGKIIVAGGSSLSANVGSRHAAVAVRFNVDGTLDATFGNAGDTSTPFRAERGVAVVLWDAAAPGIDQSNVALAVAPGPDGTIYLAGQAGPRRAHAFAVARLTPDGKVDATFGQPRQVPSAPPGTLAPAGWSTVDFTARSDYATALNVLPDGRLLLSGFASAPGRGGKGGNETSGTGLAMFDASGQLVGGYGNGPALGLPAGTSFVSARRASGGIGAAMQPDGKLVTAGLEVQQIKAVGLTPEEMRFVPTRVAYRVHRFNADGTPDRGFGRGGAARAAANPIGIGTDVEITPDGKILVAGLTSPHWTYSDANRYGNAIARLDPAGKLDRSFGPGRNGVVALPFEPAVDSSPDTAASPAPERALIERLDDGTTLVLSGASGELRVAVLPPAPAAGADLVVAPPAMSTFSWITDPNVLVSVFPGNVEKRARVKVTNTGTAPAAGTVRVRLLASKDPAADATDTVLAEAPATLRLGPRRSKAVSLSFTWPDLTGQGNFYVLSQVIADGVSEAEPNNNTAAGLVQVLYGGMVGS